MANFNEVSKEIPQGHRALSNKPVRVICIDGGGMRGIVPATFLEAMEQISGQSISELFDVAVGTSTGAILAAGLNVAADDGKSARYSASHFVNLYKDMGSTIFHRKRSLIHVLGGIVHPTYDPSSYEALLRDHFGDATIGQSLSEIAVPSIELQDMNMHIFSRVQARADQSRDFYVRDLIRAATAAPTYFPAAELSSIDGSRSGTFVDAGVSTNNPGMIAYAESRIVEADAECFFVSLGTGAITKPINAINARTWGEVEWIKAIFDLQGDAQSSYTTTVLQDLMELNPGNHFRRFQIDLHMMPFAMDDTTPAHMDKLRAAAQAGVREQEKELKELVRRLQDAA